MIPVLRVGGSSPSWRAKEESQKVLDFQGLFGFLSNIFRLIKSQ